MGFIIYDLIFLVAFAIFVFLFLNSRKKNLKKEGFLILYRTQLGIKIINYIGNKYKKALKVLSYISIFVGYILMAGIIFLFYRLLQIYIFRPDVVSAIKVPPITPLIPYIDKVVPGLPQFYFTYWIVIIAIIAITHEFAHGIFAVYNKVKIKSTGFGFFPSFLPIFLAAFVEPDEKKMNKKDRFSQMAILSAGTFANVLTGILFFAILFLTFPLLFSPQGIMFSDYSYSIVETSSIMSVNGIFLSDFNAPQPEDIEKLIKNDSLNEIKDYSGKKYLGIKAFSSDGSVVALYDDSPAINNKIPSIIKEINGVKITSIEKLREELSKYTPGEGVELRVYDGNKTYYKQIILEKNPQDENKPWIGIGFENSARTGVVGGVIDKFSSFKKPEVYYETKDGEFSQFIYYLIWWTVIISFSVALVNMLPVGIFDGGKFFMLTIWGITKNEKIAKKAFSIVTYFFLFFLLVIMVLWGISFFR